jgi:hypothetical protein
MVAKTICWLIASGGISLTALGQIVPRTAPVPGDPLELVTGPVQTVETRADREAAVQLLARARNNFALRTAGVGYDLKVTFTVNSGGQTEYDGAWEMEDIFDPTLGLHWTAKAAAGYTVAQISSKKTFYREATAATVPLRLHEARAALFDPIGSLGKGNRDLIRTSAATFQSTQLVCVLISGPGNAAIQTPGRSWEETEECIDPQSGLLRVHSQVPGRYYAYDYSNGSTLGDHVLPRQVLVTEAGKRVSVISVDSLKELPAADPSLFQPTEAMKAAGRPITLAGAEKISRVFDPGPFTASEIFQPVCVFGLVTAAGKLVEAHSLQPSDPNSEAAVEAATRLNFSHPAPPGAQPQQHFVFVIEKFVAAQ